MYEFVGQETGHVYISGKSKAECMRSLKLKYPSSTEKDSNHRQRNNVASVYPEPLNIRIHRPTKRRTRVYRSDAHV